MKKLFTFSVAAFLIMHSFGQAILPVSWSFNGSTPTGWTTSGTTFYTASPSALTNPSCKLSGTGQYVQIFVSDQMGPLKYWMKGNGTNPWTGTFTVQQSVNGSSNWLALRSFTSGSPLDANAYIEYTDTPGDTSRYIRFYYTNKVSGCNAGLDSVSIAVAPPSPTQEINVKIGAQYIPSGATHVHSSAVGVNTPVTLTVENLGTVNTLNISSAFLIGSSDYSLGAPLVSVNALSNGNLVVNFQPAVAGTSLTTLQIGNDDTNENPYVIHFYGVGGTFASDPISQPTALNFTNVKSYRFNASFTNAGTMPDAGYLVLMHIGSAVTDIPVDGTPYMRGDYVGSSQVVSSGMSTSFLPRGIVAGTSYHFSVFSYNGSGSYVNYLTAAPLTGSVTTSAVTMVNSTYYNGVTSSSSTFVTDLHNKINPHSFVYYSDFEETNVALFHTKDTTGGQKFNTCVYTGENIVYSDPFDWTGAGMSREHSFCQSWMPTYAILTSPTELPEYDDQHNLFPVDQNNANVIRSNYPLGKVVTVQTSFMEGKIGLDTIGHKVYEPRDSQKGNSARAIMYMCVCYDGVNGNPWRLPSNISSIIPYGQDQDILKKWHYLDPPDSWEMARNDFIDSLQHNRNPFIDSVDWVCYIDFKTMQKISNPTFPCNTTPIGIGESFQEDFTVGIFPNPTTGKFTLSGPAFEVSNMKVVDVLGKEMRSKNNFYSTQELDLTGLSKGMYFVEITTGSVTKFAKLVLE